MKFHEFMQVMVKQTYIWNMAGGMLGSDRPSQVASANTRRERAKRRIDDAVLARSLTIADERRCAALSAIGTAAPAQLGGPEEVLHVRCEFQRGHGKVGPGIGNPSLAHVESRADWDHGAPSAKVWWMDETTTQGEQTNG